MGKYNLSFFDCQELSGFTNAYCDIQNEGCLAINTPSTVTQFLLKKMDQNGKVLDRIQINTCNNCQPEITLPNCKED